MKKLTLLSLLFLTLFACRNDVEDLGETMTTTDPVITIIDNYNEEVIDVTASLFGTVVDENDTPIQNASVRLGTNTTSTDESGRFLIKNVAMNGAGTYVEVNFNGYFPGSARFFPEEGSTNYVKITMLEKTSAGTFNSTDGGFVSTNEGISLDFPANSVIDANGNTYEGTVDVKARWIDPTSDRINEIMPGGMQGISAVEVEEVALASFGMMAVELESPSGDALNLGNDLNATLSFPVPAELIGNAPAEIPLWYFSKTYGIWVQEGSATLDGDNYVGEVSHFSFWNCDAPFPLVMMNGRVVTEDGTPIANAYVLITIQSSGWAGAGWTDDNGVFGGKIPKDEALTIEVFQTYGCDVYSADIGPFSDDVDLGDIVITSPEVIDITGTIVDCNGDAVTNGFAEITVGDDTYTFYVSDSNNFEIAIFNCDNETDFTVLASNIDDLEQSDLLTYTVASNVDIGTVSACGNQLDEFIIVDIDGTVNTFLDVNLTIGGPDSTFMNGNIPGTDFNIFLQMNEITAAGTYPGTFIDYSSMFVETAGGASFMEIATYDELVITTYSDVSGEAIEGTFSGIGTFIEPNQQIIDYPFTASFKINRN